MVRLILSYLSNGINIMGLSPEIQQIAEGVVLILAVIDLQTGFIPRGLLLGSS
jgi:ABC-type xylose transport system permease subunit